MPSQIESPRATALFAHVCADLTIQKLKKFRVENIFRHREKIEQSKNLKLQKSENFDFFESWRISKILIFEIISVLFGAFFMSHGAARPYGNSYLVAADRRSLGFLGTLHD